LREKTASNTIDYIFGIDGGAIGFKLNNVQYWYVKNLQGDVTSIYNASGTCVAKYSYNAWGNCTIVSSVGGIAELNAIRYRSYHYDSETGLYCMTTRYYDPEVGRFISPDFIEILDITKNHVNGLNLYSYCGNDPVNKVDSNGMLWSWVYKNIIKPVGNAFNSAVNWVDNTIIQPINNHVIQPAMNWVDNNIVSPIGNAFNTIGSLASSMLFSNPIVGFGLNQNPHGPKGGAPYVDPNAKGRGKNGQWTLVQKIGVGIAAVGWVMVIGGLLIPPAAIVLIPIGGALMIIGLVIAGAGGGAN